MSDNFTLPTTPANEQKPQVQPEKKKESSTILNIILVILGLLFIGKGVLDFLAWSNPQAAPSWISSLHSALSSKDAGAALSFFGNQAIVSTMLGLWCFIAGILLFRERATGWGMSIVLTSTIAANGISAIIGTVTATSVFDFLYWPNWVVILVSFASILGFFFLLMTRKRYQ
jgi:hypothetical protein